MTTAELVKQIEELTPEHLAEVADFVAFLRAKQPPPIRRRISARGKFAHIPGSTDEFMQRKEEEKKLEERRWK